MVASQKQKWTVEEYLAMERASEEKHEFLDGEIYLMSGASENHNLIVGVTVGIFYNQLRKRPCSFYPSDMRVKVKDTGLYTYPDITIVCGTPEIESMDQDTLLNPTVIIEVLSPSTESYDRGKKFQHYRELDSLQEYILIAQDQARIERYLRQPSGEWLLTDAVGLEAVIELPSIECTLALADVYEKVSFEPGEAAPPT
ncbi:MAG: Uma2 family endonuclease [Chloroflexi bacterium]|nr:Uma2 family endonuclease [Chloroflexota bacterium]